MKYEDAWGRWLNMNKDKDFTKMSDLFDDIYNSHERQKNQIMDMAERAISLSRLSYISDAVYKEGLVSTLKDIKEFLRKKNN